MATYPGAIKTFTALTDGIDNVLASHQNEPNDEITAIQTELGAAPKTITDTVAPSASPTSVAQYLDMVATICKTITGSTTWTNSAAAAIMKSIGTAKGDLISFTGSAVSTRIALSTTVGHALLVSTSTTTGIDWGAVTESILSISDTTVANSSTLAHGFLKKLSGNSTEFINGAGNWTTPSGSNVFVQSQAYQTGAVASSTTTIAADDSIPQNTEGFELMTLAVTPTSATNKLRIGVTVFAASSTVDVVIAALFQDTTADALAAGFMYASVAGDILQVTFTHTMTAGTTSATTFKVRAGTNGGATLTFNGSGGARKLGGVLASSIVISEITP